MKTSQLNNLSPEEKVEMLFDLMEKQRFSNYIGEAISQLEHGYQAALAAERVSDDTRVILAAFFHDIGHFIPGFEKMENMDGLGVKDHDKLGADFLREFGFPELTCRLIENHVAAKRYLCFKNPHYYNRLSEASKGTLAFQGGPMTAEEAAFFEKDAFFEWYLRIRSWDEMAKEKEVEIKYIERLKLRCLELLSGN